ncbi:MAG: hypothetical protein H6981_10985 [Gammaproteobacteria bacterium]|nr:hypothetical protein [Gammaproteobacteria bacterium]MCP5137310.1 hypothetical protein [Gammaproteobacteria bacterium]
MLNTAIRAFALSLAVLILSSSSTLADDGGWIPREQRDTAAPDVAIVTNPEYRTACGECHLAYQPGLLPARSWQQITEHLPWHFGNSLNIEPEILERLKRYLELAAADRNGYLRSIKIMIDVPEDTTPLRISELTHVRVEHAKSEISVEKAAERVGGLHRCEGCHTRAESGFYNEHEVVMPLLGDATGPKSEIIESGSH